MQFSPGSVLAIGQSSLFTLSADNAMVQLLNRGGPRVLESQARADCLTMHCRCLALNAVHGMLG